MEGERGFGALVCVEVRFAETVAAASCREVVERTVEPIAAKEPVEGITRPPSVVTVPGRGKRTELGLDERGRIERLLVTGPGRRLVATSPVMPRQPEHAVVEAAFVAQPRKRLESDRDSGGSPKCRSPTMSAWESRALSYVRRSSNHSHDPPADSR